MPVHIPVDRHETLVSVLREAAQVNGDTEAYVEPGGPTGRQALTFAQWDAAADGVAGLLTTHGVTKGDVVCLMLPSCIDYAVVYAAAARLGAIVSGINPRMGAGEVASIVERTSPSLLVTDPDVPVPPGLPEVARLSRTTARQSWGGDPPGRWPALAAHDPVVLVWTSGTTGRPKGALFDHANLAAVALGTDVICQPGDRRLFPVPFAHVGYMTRTWDEIAHGVTTVITPTPWKADEALRIMAAERITVAQGVPTQYALMLASPELDRVDLSALRIATTGAARMAASTVAEVRRRFGVPVVVRYTSTEASLGTSTTLASTDEEVATTVGQPVAGVELAIVDDEGAPLPDGVVGRVLLRSAATMRGYWDRGPGRGRTTAELIDREATATVLADDGWLTTGDFGLLTEAGNLQLSGRAHERYIRGGYNVYPAEVEEVLVTHPDVARVAVVGTPDDVLGEIGVAVVVAAPGAQPELGALRAHCSGALSDYKAPDALVLVEELPLTPMMKVDPNGLASLAERGAAERRAARLARDRGAGPRVLGSGRADESDESGFDEKERA